jgi:ATP-dependent 26S proteasome regulatory subunit
MLLPPRRKQAWDKFAARPRSLRKKNRKADLFTAAEMKDLVEMCNEFTGAEIEVWVKEALVSAFNKNHKDLEIADFLISDTPLCRRLRQSSPFAGLLPATSWQRAVRHG